MKAHLGHSLGRGLRGLLVAALLSFGLATGVGGCGAPPMGSPLQPIPPPDPTIEPGILEMDAAGVGHLYWKVTSPPESQLGHVWIYLNNDNLGVGVSLRALADGSYSTRIEGQEGDRILFGFGASYTEAEVRFCRPLRAGLATTPCR